MKDSRIPIVILFFACLLVGTAILKTANAASSFKLDFYLWFNFDPSEISLSEIKEFEFSPSIQNFAFRHRIGIRISYVSGTWFDGKQ